MTNNESGNETLVFIAGLSIGALVGFAFGILAAPHSGSVTRRKVIRTGGEVRDQVSEVIDDLEESGRELLNDVRRVAR
tara:strand:- start:317 stop:550 length:234 start_codon:yes stop_codon:yes gene_type:complete